MFLQMNYQPRKYPQFYFSDETSSNLFSCIIWTKLVSAKSFKMNLIGLSLKGPQNQNLT